MECRDLECWDDDEDLQVFETFDFRASLASAATGNHRASISSSRAGSVSSRAGSHYEPDEEWDNPSLIPDDKSKRCSPLPAASSAIEDYDDDLEIPNNGEPLKLIRRDAATSNDAFDNCGLENILEASSPQEFQPGGTRRAAEHPLSERHVADIHDKAALPSIIPESADEDLAFDEEDLILPDDDKPLKLAPRIATDGQNDHPPEKFHPRELKSQDATTPATDDFLSGLEIGDIDVFDAKKLAVNRNIKHRVSRIPRPATVRDRGHSKLEPVSESGGPISSYKRPDSRLGNHAVYDQPNGLISTPTSSYTVPPFTPSRRGLSCKRSREVLRGDASNSTIQLLKTKRSSPAIRTQYSPGKPHVPFLPAGNTGSQSHHVTSKTSMPSRSLSRQSFANRPNTPTRGRKGFAPEALAREAAAKRTLMRPAKRRNFGDGNELDAFDDLPTSASVEGRYIRPAVGKGAPKLARGPLGNSSPAPLRNLQVKNMTPSFARETTASRLARESRTGVSNSKPEIGHSIASRLHGYHPPMGRTLTSPNSTKSEKRAAGASSKLGLIKGLGDGTIKPKSEKGMRYNPTMFRWEGNDLAVAGFESPAVSPELPSEDITKSKSKLALITNISSSQSVKAVGGMVFDPQRMCWLKIGPSTNPLSSSADDDDEDPFAGLDDLEEKKDVNTGENKSTLSDEWLVGEEFDVGPAFVKRQKDEEANWARIVGPWLSGTISYSEDARCLLRSIKGSLVEPAGSLLDRIAMEHF
ncbi:hypothetical protein L228DRAFT_249440 [Xylona heveae TC161]|uniref:Cytokinesis regulator n=1 Tax=Xylona heveae (strain CBS 132557 / TC161) TaxID=1328760 RepID=A0A165AKX3_XYLHT|nr:hypothetical protein L228DRAFT_249440 [Xylona heveae TC161]KZF20658.1 hypothetical protein L228DRAFT_249440 [Xylona heveae TC161]